MSCIVTETVLSYPSETIPSESPTKIISIGDLFTKRAGVKSHAVIMVSGVPAVCFSFMVDSVTRFNAAAVGEAAAGGWALLRGIEYDIMRR